MGSSAQNSSGVHWCRHRGQFQGSSGERSEGSGESLGGGSWVSHCPSQKFDLKIAASTSIQRPGSISQNAMAVFVGCRTMTFPAAPCNKNQEGTSFTSIEMFHTRMLHTHMNTYIRAHTHIHTHIYIYMYTYTLLGPRVVRQNLAKTKFKEHFFLLRFCDY